MADRIGTNPFGHALLTLLLMQALQVSADQPWMMTRETVGLG